MIEENRWDHYLMRHGREFLSFWKEYLQTDRDILYILGWGFDPRTCIGIEKLVQIGGGGTRDCMLIDFDEGDVSPSRKHDDLRQKNLKILDAVIAGKFNKIEKKITVMDENNHRVESRKAARLFSSPADLMKYTDVVVDISALPPDIYFPLLGKILHLIDKNSKSGKMPNLHVIVAENAELDSKIKDQEIEEDAGYLYGFASDLPVESNELASETIDKIPKVWIPIMGENKSTQMERIYVHVKPDEICPVLPSPAVNPRRSDDLIIEYREILASMQMELKNIIYGSEQNPFEVYREIFRTVNRYMATLRALGGCKVALSPLSSKLLSMSAFLVAYEAIAKDISVGIAHVSARGYMMDQIENIESLTSRSELFTLWIAGDCYAR